MGPTSFLKKKSANKPEGRRDGSEIWTGGGRGRNFPNKGLEQRKS